MEFSWTGAIDGKVAASRFPTMRSLLGIGGVIILGAVFRFYRLTDESYWLDELYSVDFSRPDRSAAEVMGITLSDVHPPIYQLLLWCWYHLFGFTEFAGRSLSAVIGTLCIPVFYLLGRDLFDRRVGIAAATIAAVNLYLVRYSQETRSYELLVMLTGLSWLFLYRTLDRRTYRELACYVVSTILLIYTHYVSFFFIAAQFLYCGMLWLRRQDERRRIFLHMTIAGFAFAIALIPLLPYILGRSQDNVLPFVSKPSPLIFTQLVRAHFGSIPVLVLAVPAVFALWRLRSPAVPRREKQAVLFLLAWTILGYVILYIKSVVSSPILYPRYTMPQILPITLLGAYGYASIKLRYKTIGAALFVLTAVYVLYVRYYLPVVKDDFRQALLDLKAQGGANIPVYERMPYNGWEHLTNHFQAYADLLGMGVAVRDDQSLKGDLSRSSLPPCFWMLDATFNAGENPPFAESSWARQPGITAVHVNSHNGAESVLLASGVDAGGCADYRPVPAR